MKNTAKTILISLVVLLLGTNIATIVTYRSHLTSEQQAPVTTDSQIISIPDQQVGRFLRDTLNLDIDQQQKFRTTRRAYHQNANQILNELNTIRTKMAMAMRNTRPDMQTLDSLAVLLGEKHSELKRATFAYYYQLQQELSPEQQKQLALIFESMLSNEQVIHPQNRNNRGLRNGQNRRKR